MSDSTDPPTTRPGADAAVFDWYSATIDDDPFEVIRVLEGNLHAVERRVHGRRNYPEGAQLVREGNVVATVYYGGSNGNPNAFASGEDAIRFAEVVRHHWPSPQHYVTRADVAYDFKEGKPWDELYELCVATADAARPRLSLATEGDWVRAEEDFPGGRTLYVGSRKSAVFSRLYEKGKQLRAAFPDQLDKFPLDWVRLELEVKPEHDARLIVAGLDPVDVWGTSKWATSLHAAVFDSGLSPVPMQKWRQPDDARAWSYLLQQYGPLLRRKVAAELARLEDAGHVVRGADAESVWRELGSELGAALN